MSKAMLFVHGAFHGPWCWEHVVLRLEEQGVPCRSIELYRGGLEADAQAAVASLRPNPSYGPVAPSGQPLWERVPSTYLWCDDDRAVRPAFQREIARHTTYSEGFQASHSPMISQPEALAAVLLRVLDRT